MPVKLKPWKYQSFLIEQDCSLPYGVVYLILFDNNIRITYEYYCRLDNSPFGYYLPSDTIRFLKNKKLIYARFLVGKNESQFLKDKAICTFVREIKYLFKLWEIIPGG